MGWKLLTVTAASTAPAIPPENRDNAGDIRCLPASSGFGLRVILLGLATPTMDLAVEVIDAIVNNDSSILYYLDSFSRERSSKHWAIQEQRIGIRDEGIRPNLRQRERLITERNKYGLLSIPKGLTERVTENAAVRLSSTWIASSFPRERNLHFPCLWPVRGLSNDGIYPRQAPRTLSSENKPLRNSTLMPIRKSSTAINTFVISR